MADTLIKMKTGTIAKMEQKNNGTPVVPLEEGTVYFAIDTENNLGKIVYDAPDGNGGIDRIVMSTQAEYADEAGGPLATTSNAGFISASDKAKLDGIAQGAQVNSVTGVKGSSESTYRTGNINITKANIGLGNVENKSSATIRGELTSNNVTTALGYAPATQTVATTSANGLMSATDKANFDTGLNIAGNTVAIGGSITADALRTSLGLSNAMHFIGIATVAITDGSTTNPVINGYDFGTNGINAKSGDVVIDKDSSYEFVWTGIKWERLGPDGSYALSDHTHSDATTSVAGFMSALDKSKLDTIAQNANNYSHPTGDGNLHVPATGTTNNNKILVAGSTAGSLSWKSIGNHTYTKPTGATSRTADVAVNTTTVNSITAVGTLPTLTVTATDVVTSGTTTDVPNISKKTVVTSATAATASYADGILTISNGSVTTGDSVTVGTAIKAYTGLTTSSIGSASGWSAGTLPTKGTNTTVATGIKTQPTFTVATTTDTLSHTLS